MHIEMSKVDLQTLRAERIADLEAAGTMGQREEIQADLSNINARLKLINTEEARQAKVIADQRKAIGHAEQRDNLRRASARLPARPSTKPPSPKPSVPATSQHLLTRGGFLLKHAKQMGKAIDSIKPDRRLPHTIAFRIQLDAFILQQKQHLDEQAKASTSSHVVTEGDWQRIWMAEAVETPE